MSSASEIIIVHSQPETEENNWLRTVANSLKISVINLIGVNCEVRIENVSEFKSSKNDLRNIILVLSDKALSGQENQGIRNFCENLNADQHVFVVLQEFIEVEKIPASIREKPVYNFFDVNPVSGNHRYYAPDEDEEVTKLFWAKILDVAYDITLIVQNSKIKAAENAVFLAETTPDQYENHDLIKSELIHRGFTVYPGHLLTGTIEKLNAEINEYLTKCHISVHILGNQYGDVIPGSEYSLIELQYRAAAKRWKETVTDPKSKTFQRLIWIKPGLKPTDERHKWFIGSLRIEEKDASTEIMQTAIEDLKSNLRNKLSSNNQEIKVSYKNSSGIYLIHENRNIEKIDELKKYLTGKGLDILTIDYSKDSGRLLTQHYDFLINATSVIICDFEGNEFWIKSKIKDIMKSPGLGRTEPFKAKALFTSKKNIGNLSNGHLLLDANKNIAEALEPFIKKINANG